YMNGYLCTQPLRGRFDRADRRVLGVAPGRCPPNAHASRTLRIDSSDGPGLACQPVDDEGAVVDAAREEADGVEAAGQRLHARRVDRVVRRLVADHAAIG